MSSDQTEWAVLDDLLGLEKATTFDTSREDLAFYGRCSTEDNQDPETSYQWQLGNAEKFVDGTIVTSYFDIGQSRSVPWHRRTHANRLLEDLRNPDRGGPASLSEKAPAAGSVTSSASSLPASTPTASRSGFPNSADATTPTTSPTR